MTRDARAEAAAIRKIPHQGWDPIGCGVPEDEYDSYLWPVYSLLMRKAASGGDRWYLRAADVNMASPVSEARLSAVVNKLMALGLENESPSSLKPEGRGNAES